ncbi:MAG: sulfatase-like hydrolase/transferase [Pirellulaceae bacterium]
MACQSRAVFVVDRTTWLRFLVRCVVLLGFALFGPSAAANDKPNILWITSEDNSSFWLGCYGNEQAQTPNLDRLASQGTLFRNAYANAPVCAVARSTLLNGVHAVSQGTHHMRSRYPIDERFRPYVEYLKDAGYYCTNRSKTDFNFWATTKRFGMNAQIRHTIKTVPPTNHFFNF